MHWCQWCSYCDRQPIYDCRTQGQGASGIIYVLSRDDTAVVASYLKVSRPCCARVNCPCAHQEDAIKTCAKLHSCRTTSFVQGTQLHTEIPGDSSWQPQYQHRV